MAYASISLGGLTVTIDNDATYPDALDDTTNRVKAMFSEALIICQENDIDPVDAMFVPDLEDDEED